MNDAIAVLLSPRNTPLIWSLCPHLTPRSAKLGTVSVRDLDRQMAKIRSHWMEIQYLFGRNRIDVVASDGQRMSPEEIWRRISIRSA